MDKKTQKVLAGISSRAPLRKLTKVVTDTSLEEAARDAMREPGFKGNRKRIEKMIEGGKFRTSEEVEDEAAIKEIDDYNTREVRAAIDRGEIPDPANDPFVKEREWRQKNKDPNAVSSYQSLMAGIKASRKITPTFDRVLLQFVPKEEKTTSGIIIPDSAKKQSQVVEAVVFRIGKECKYELKEGERVYVNAYDFDPIEHEGTLFMIGHEQGILLKQEL